MKTADKIQGLFLGILIGDALGMPAETFTPEKIIQNFGELRDYQPSTREGWETKPAGSYTDDTQLTLAVANAIIDGNGLDMDAQANRHVEAFHQSTSGWGGTTKQAMENLVAGKHWSDAAAVGPGLGYGNAMPMKIAPVAAFAALRGTPEHDVVEFIAKLSDMTHGTAVSRAAGQAQYEALRYCLNVSPGEFVLEDFKTQVLYGAAIHNCPEFEASLLQAFTYTANDAVLKIGGEGKARFSCFTSVPLAYYCFIHNPTNIESLFSAVSAGGDTDTNASIVGGLLGALFGPSIFPEYLVAELYQPALAEVNEVTANFLAALQDEPKS